MNYFWLRADISLSKFWLLLRINIGIISDKYSFCRYTHVRHLIQNFNHREPGYCLLLHALLDFVEYKEYDVMTNYFFDNLEDVSN